MERRNIEVPRAHSGEAVARIVHDGLGVPHSTAKGLIDAGCVTINGRPVRSHGQRCDGGDVVEVRFDPERRYEPSPQPRHGPGFRVVHEDPEIVVVDKSPGVLSSPAPGRREDSLAELIAESLRARGIRKPQLFVVHRLDQHTSGLLVFAKTSRAMEWLVAQFESREAGRVYTAVVSGRVERQRGTIQSWLVEDPKSLAVHTTPLRGAGKRAITHFAVAERFDDATLVRVGLETGRKHQIRVHFAEIGHPVLGDRRYSDASPLLARVALHAERLTFRHPRTLEKMTFEAPWPEDLSRLVNRLRRGAEGHEDAAGTAATDPSPRAGSPFGRPGAAPEVLTRADAARASRKEDGRPEPRTSTRPTVFPQGLTLTDPMGPTASHLLDPVETRGAVGGPTPAAKPTRDRRGKEHGDRPKSFDRRERLLRERSVGGWRPRRRDASEEHAAPPPRTDAPRRDESARGSWKRKGEAGGPGYDGRGVAPRSDKRGGDRRDDKRVGDRREDKRDADRRYDRGGGDRRDDQRGAAWHRDAGPGASRPRGHGAQRDKSQGPQGRDGSEATRYRGQGPPRRDGSGAPPHHKGQGPPRRGGSGAPPHHKGPRAPRREGSAPPRREGSAPPRREGSAPPHREGSAPPRREGSAPPRREGSAPPPRRQGSAPPRRQGSAPPRHKAQGGARKPWEFEEKGSTLWLERRRKIAAAKGKRHGKGKKT